MSDPPIDVSFCLLIATSTSHKRKQVIAALALPRWVVQTSSRIAQYFSRMAKRHWIALFAALAIQLARMGYEFAFKADLLGKAQHLSDIENGLPMLTTTTTTWDAVDGPEEGDSDDALPSHHQHLTASGNRTFNVTGRVSRGCTFPARYADGTEMETPGFEDFAMLNDTHAVSCAGDLRTLWHPSQDTATMRNGVCALVVLTYPSVEVHPLSMEGFPSDVAFHPHGMYLRRTSADQPAELYVVNHAYTHGGERVDVFRVDATGRRLAYRGSVASPWLTTHYNGILNALVVAADGRSFYATSWMPHPDPPEGRKQTWWWSLAMKARLFLQMVDTKVLWCQLDVAALSPSAPPVAPFCKVVATGMIMANGISWAAGGRLVAVADTVGHSLWLIDACGAEDLPPTSTCPSREVWLRHAADNLHLEGDVEVVSPPPPETSPSQSVTMRTTLLTGAIYHVMNAANSLDHRGTSSIRAPGGLTRLTLTFSRITAGSASQGGMRSTLRLTRLDEEDLVANNGTYFYGAAGGVIMSEGGTEVAVIGSFKSHGLMTCPLS